MAIWKNCKAEVLFTDRRQAWEAEYLVEISDTHIIVTVDDNEVWRGENHGTGHFRLVMQGESNSTASLHLAQDSNSLEGSWSCKDDDGMWRIHIW